MCMQISYARGKCICIHHRLDVRNLIHVCSFDSSFLDLQITEERLHKTGEHKDVENNLILLTDFAELRPFCLPICLINQAVSCAKSKGQSCVKQSFIKTLFSNIQYL